MKSTPALVPWLSSKVPFCHFCLCVCVCVWAVASEQAIKAEIPQIQVFQGQEPGHFRRIFGQGRDHGRLIVHDRVWRKRDNPEKRVSLFKVQRMPDEEFQTFQVGILSAHAGGYGGNSGREVHHKNDNDTYTSCQGQGQAPLDIKSWNCCYCYYYYY